jgi:hypothetical protein
MLLVVDAAAVIPNIIMNNSGSRTFALILPQNKVFKKATK